MPDFLRRAALLTIVGAVTVGLLAPLTAGSAIPTSTESARLLAAADRPFSLADRAATGGRNRAAALSLSSVSQPIGTEILGDNAALATPPSAPMEATLYRRVVRAVPALVTAPVTGNTITGKATWYCCSAGWRGQAVVALPGALGGHYDAPPAA